VLFQALRGTRLFVAGSGPGQFPFTSSCEAGETEPYYAVFADVSVYAEAGLTTKICGLTAGAALPIGEGSRGAALTGGFDLDGPATYEVSLDGFSERCGGQQSGFISVPQTHLHGSNTWLVPLTTVAGAN
jgi:hypothetical protein